jgi:hypothetical protein
LHAATETCATLCSVRSEDVAEQAATTDAIAARQAHATRGRRFAENMLPPCDIARLADERH